MLVREATTRDARAIARVHVRSWQIGFAGMVAAEYLAALSLEESTTRWLRGLADPTQPETVVCEDGEGNIIGWASFGPDLEAASGECGELMGLHVDPGRWSRGAGSALLLAVEAGMSARGFRKAMLWTLEANTRTRRFYEQRGWRFTGNTRLHPSGSPVVQYERDLGGAGVDPRPDTE